MSPTPLDTSLARDIADRLNDLLAAIERRPLARRALDRVAEGTTGPLPVSRRE